MGKLNVANRTLFTYGNLSVMQGINSETIDLIYLDPPFNSKRNYAAPIGSQAAGAAFKDTWTLDDIKKEWVEEIEADNKATWASIVSAGHISGESMQAYLTYMAIDVCGAISFQRVRIISLSSVSLMFSCIGTEFGIRQQHLKWGKSTARTIHSHQGRELS